MKNFEQYKYTVKNSEEVMNKICRFNDFKNPELDPRKNGKWEGSKKSFFKNLFSRD